MTPDSTQMVWDEKQSLPSTARHQLSQTVGRNTEAEISSISDSEKEKVNVLDRLPLPRSSSRFSSLHKVVSPLPFAQIIPESPSDHGDLYPEGGLRANLVVFGSFCAMISAFGLVNTVGTLQTYLSTHQLSSYSPASIGWIFSIYIFMSFFGGLQVGPIFDAKGPKALIAAGTVTIVGGVLAMANATEYWHFVLSFSILAGLGTSLLFTPAISAIAHFFNKRRGAATGLAATGGSVGGVIFPLSLPPLFDRIGYPWTMRLLALILLLMCGLANLLVRARLPPKKGGSVWPDVRIFRDVSFAVSTAGVFFLEFGLFVPLTYLSSWALKTGVGNDEFGYQLLAILNAASFFGRWMPGFIADRWGRFNTMLMASGLCLVFLVGLWLPGSLSGEPRGSVALAVMFSLGFGFASGSGISLTPVCIGELCGTEEYGRYYATCYTVVSFGCLTGVPIAGEIVRRCGGEYGGLVGFTAGCYAAAFACFAFVRVRKVGWGWNAAW